MPEQWMRDLMGEEARPRPGFEDELAERLGRGWREASPARPWVKVLGVAAVVALVIGGVAVLTGRDDTSGVSTETTSTAGPSTTGSSTSVDSSTATTAPSPAGERYLAFGSSVMEGAREELEAAGIVVNASADFTDSAIVDALYNAAELGLLGASSTVLLQVGQNGGLTEDNAATILAAVPTTVRHVVVMTLTGPTAWIPEANQVIRALPSLDPRVTVADWASVAADAELCPDGVHVSCSGQARTFYVSFVQSALELASAPGSTSSTTTTDPALPEGAARPIKEYVVALANGDWMAAARLLGEGELEWTARADLRPLYRNEFGLRRDDRSFEGLAAALARWCTRAACAGAVERIDDLGDGWFSVALAGQGNVSLLQVSMFEGVAAVRGLPLSTRPSPLSGGNAPSELCPTDLPIDRTSWADLDGDGWVDLLVTQVIGQPAGDESGVRDYRITVCGTSTSVAPLEVTGDSLLVSAVNPAFLDGGGGDTLLIGFLEGYYNGDVYRYDPSGSLVVVTRDGEPVQFGFAPPEAGPAGTSVGCDAFWPGDGDAVLIRFVYTVEGGQVAYTASDLLTGALLAQGTLSDVDTLPLETDQALQLRTGSCHGLPVVAY